MNVVDIETFTQILREKKGNTGPENLPTFRHTIYVEARCLLLTMTQTSSIAPVRKDSIRLMGGSGGTLIPEY